VEDIFSKIWNCGDTHLHTLQEDWLNSHSCRGVQATEAELGVALNTLRHSAVLDSQGICVAAVHILHSACRGYVIAVINRLAMDRQEMESIIDIVEGKTK